MRKGANKNRSGILSADSLLLAKSAVELLVRTIVDRVNQFRRWQSWMILLGLVTIALTQLYYLHRGLRLCSTSVLYPLVFCVYNIFAILGGKDVPFLDATLLNIQNLCRWVDILQTSISAIPSRRMSHRLGDSDSPHRRPCPFMATY